MRLAAILSRRTRPAGAVSRRMAPVATLALPVAAALVLPLTPVVAGQGLPAAQAQVGSLSGNLGPGSGTDYLEPDSVPDRTPIDVTEQPLTGLPAGVSVDRVEWITDRWANVFIKSAAMPGDPVKVQILMARDWYSQPSKKFPTLLTLDGLRARDDESGWTLETNIASFYADKNVNVVLPVGGNSSFYSDWQQPDNGKHYMWETFLTKELPAVLREGWRANDQRGVVGLSMGGTAAMNLAERNPQMYKFAGSFSGYLDTSSFGMPQALGAATRDGGGFDATKMWGPYGSQGWIDHDPKLGVDALKNMSVYVSSGNGNAGLYDRPGPLPGTSDNYAGTGLEIMSRMTTETFVREAKKKNVNVITAFRPSGTHSWPYWQFEMTQAWPHIADSFGLSKDDRGTTCQASGAIGAGLSQYPHMGACISNEYDGPRGGKIQDFRGGRAYWSQSTGAHYLWGRIGARYSELKGPESWLGYPTGEEKKLAKGAFAEFENGNIYWTPEIGAVEVPKTVMDVWGKTGYENGPLGYPISAPEKVAGKGLIQKFQNGVVVLDEKDQGNYVQGEIAKKYLLLGGLNSQLGVPTSAELDAARGGKFSNFAGGAIYWSAGTGAHAIYNGKIRDAWAAEKWESGKLGFPISDQAAIPAGGNEIKFEHGVIREINGRVEVR